MSCARKARSQITGRFSASAASTGMRSACCSDAQILSGWLIAMTAAPMPTPKRVAARRPGLRRRDRAGAVSDVGSSVCPWMAVSLLKGRQVNLQQVFRGVLARQLGCGRFQLRLADSVIANVLRQAQLADEVLDGVGAYRQRLRPPH